MSSGVSGMLKSGIEPRVDRHRVALHTAHHQPPARGSQIGGRINDASDRLLRGHTGDRASDEELVPDRSHRHLNTGQRTDTARPGPGRIDHQRRRDRRHGA